MFFYIDESGYQGDYIFAAVGINDPKIAKYIIKKWRDWMKNKIKGFNQNEYHDRDATDQERKKILSAIANHTPEQFKFWAVLREKYNGDHPRLYIPTVTELLRNVGITENDTIIAVDKVDTEGRMERYIRQIKRKLEMPGLNMSHSRSEKEKGIQVADAIAGALSREYCPREDSISYCDLIIHLLGNDIKIIRE